MPDVNGHFTYNEWQQWAVDKITSLSIGRLSIVNQSGHSKPVDEKTRREYLEVQIVSMLQQALRHGRSGRGDDDPVTP